VKPKAKESIIEEKQKAQRRRSQHPPGLRVDQVIGEKKVEKPNSKFGQGFASRRKARIYTFLMNQQQSSPDNNAKPKALPRDILETRKKRERRAQEQKQPLKKESKNK
jgi:hypothetical protein